MAGPYTGTTTPYWMSIQGNGSTANPTANSEFVAVPAGGFQITGSQFEVTVASTINWASGATIALTYFNASFVAVGSTQFASTGALTANTQVQIATPAYNSPAGAAWIEVAIQFNGTPAATTQLQVFEAQIFDNQGMTYNANFAFVYSYAPWTGSNSAVLQWNYLPTAPGSYDSLTLNGTIELMGGPGGVPSQIPELQDLSGNGVTFRLVAPPSNNAMALGYETTYDLNAPQPTTDIVQTMLLDGERPFGYRASNRTVTLPILIFATTEALALRAREYLMWTIDQQTWQTVFTPHATGLPMILDCFRAAPSAVSWGFLYDGQTAADYAGTKNNYIGMITIQFQALPYGRSDTDGTVTHQFASPLIGGVTAANPVTVDNFSSAGSNAHWTAQTISNPPVASTSVVHYQPPIPLKSPYPAAVFSKTGLTLDLRNLTTMSVWVGQAYSNQWATDRKFHSNLVLSYVLTDVNSNTLKFSVTRHKAPWSTDQHNPKWTQIHAQIPQGNQNFNYQKVTSYSLTITNSCSRGTNGLQRMVVYLDNMVANPSTTPTAVATRAAVYNLMGFNGMARSPVSAQFQLPTTGPVSQELYGSGVWWPPPGVTQVQCEAIGGGGAGGSLTAAGVAGGGGGGEYALEPAIAVTPGKPVAYACGAGGIPPQPQTVVTFTTPGTGNWKCPANVTTAQVECWGGGAAGGAGAGGGGGGAYAKETAIAVTAGNSYQFTVGAGGVANSGTTAQLIAARGGNKSKFQGDSGGALTGAVLAPGAATSRTGSSSGGSGGVASGNATAYSGGNGGTSPGSGGGGGGSSASSSGPGAVGGTATGSTGGAGGTAGAGGGNGGTGANTPGFAVAGSNPGGGGGGGCTTSRGNQVGANGGNGQVQITYTVNGGVAVAGGTTTFGSSGASLTVTAHGGASVANNTVGGGTGGTGSANTTHNNGGTGAWSSALSPAVASSLISQVAQSNFTAASQTITSTGSGTISTGTLLVVILAAAAATFTITDNAGNTYPQVNSVAIGGGAQAYTFAAPVGATITLGTSTLSVTASVNQSYAVQWLSTPYDYGVDATGLTTGTGTGTAVSMALNNTASSTDLEVLLIANNGSATISTAPTAPMWSVPSNNTMSSGTMRSALYVGQNASNVPGVTATATLSGSTTWGAIAIPLLQSYSVQPPILIGQNLTTTAGTTQSITVDQNIPASGVIVYMISQLTGAGTLSAVTDSGSNVYTLQESAVATGKFSFYTAPVTTALTGGTSTLSFTDGTSQTHMTAAWYIPGATAFDIGTTATGTSTGPSGTSATASQQIDFVLGMIVNASAVGLSVNPAAPWDNIGQIYNNTNLVCAPFVQQALSTTGITCSGTYPSSIAWGVVTLSLKMTQAGGGGAGSGGQYAPGYNGAGSQGGPAVLGGGKGASGSSNPGTPPGGGGSGAVSSGSAATGGTGGNGYCIVTWQPPLQAFNTLIVHRPGLDAPAQLNPAVPLNTADTPTNIEYAVPSLVSGVNALFNGTYTVVLTNYIWDSPSTARQITVTVAQYEYQGGPSYKTTLTRTVTPATDIVNGVIFMGEMTLPKKEVDPSTTSAYFTVSITDTDTNDRFLDVLFLDTQGQTTIVNIPSGNAGYGTYTNFFIDEPTLEKDLGRYLGSAMDRSQAISVLDSAIVSGGPLYVTSGENIILAYSTAGAPNLGVAYNPRWFSVRSV